MEHNQFHPFSPQEHHHLMSSTLFEDGTHFHGGFDPVAMSTFDESWDVDDLMLLGGELFANNEVGDHPCQCGGSGDLACQCGGCPHLGLCSNCGASPQPSLCLDDDQISPPLGQDGASVSHEQSRDDGDMSPTRKRRDRSKTIVSERKRRVRMKERLYELRSLVPNITKMDKASIIADAVMYVKNLQSHAKKLQEEVSVLESSRSKAKQARRPPHQHQEQCSAMPCTGNEASDDDAGHGRHHGAKLTHVGAAQVGEQQFFVTVECERRDGVAAPLCAAVESLACFRVESSNYSSSSDRVLSTLTLKASELGEDAIDACTVRLWVMAAHLKEGFQPEATVAILS